MLGNIKLCIPVIAMINHVYTLPLYYWSYFMNRALHTLVGVVDNALTGDFRLARPHWNNMARLSWHPKYPNPLQIYGWVICFEINCTWKQISHRVMFVYRCWSEMELIDKIMLGNPASFAGCSKRSHSNCTCLHAKVRREICQDSRYEIRRYIWFAKISHHEIFVVVLEVAVNLFTTTWFQIRKFTSARPIFGKWPCYRSFDHSANWRVKDCMQNEWLI